MKREVGLAYDVVDVFTATAFAGNPLAVVHGAEGLDTSQLQALAREFHLSETAFPLAATAEEAAAGATYGLRIFTPEAELPFAGHPSIGTAWLLAQQGRIAPGTVVQACGAGLLPLTVSPAGGAVELAGGTSQAGPLLDPAQLLATLGLAHPDLDGLGAARLTSAGLPYSILPIRADALTRCEPNLERLRAQDLANRSAGVYVVAIDLAAQAVRARMFASDLGVPEDPATGSAALALGVWLASAGLLDGDGDHGFVIEQGVDMGRPSLLRLRVVTAADNVQCFVAGEVVHIASGTIRVPDLT